MKTKVIAFEPSSNYVYLNSNVSALNDGRFESHQILLGKSVGMMQNEIWESWGNRKVRRTFQHSSLDIFFKEKLVGKKVIIKVDTDGFELDIIGGAESFINRYKPLVIIESNHAFESGQSLQKLDSLFNSLDYMHVGTLDSNNEIYIHKKDSQKSELRNIIRRKFLVSRGYLGQLVFGEIQISNFSKQRVRFTPRRNKSLFFQSVFSTDGIPWSYFASSSKIGKHALYIRISGLVIGADANLVLVTESDVMIFSLPLVQGLYRSILIPIKNQRYDEDLQIIVRTGAISRKTTVFGLRVDVLY